MVAISVKSMRFVSSKSSIERTASFRNAQNSMIEVNTVLYIFIQEFVLFVFWGLPLHKENSNGFSSKE